MVNIFMVDINEERHVHNDHSPSFLNIFHNPGLVWSDNSTITEVHDGDIIVQYYTKGRGKYFIFGLSHGTSFRYKRPSCSFHTRNIEGRAVRIVGLEGPHRIRGDILDQIYLYADSCVGDEEVEEKWEYDRSFISIIGKTDIWKVNPGLSTIIED